LEFSSLISSLSYKVVTFYFSLLSVSWSLVSDSFYINSFYFLFLMLYLFLLYLLTGELISSLLDYSSTSWILSSSPIRTADSYCCCPDNILLVVKSSIYYTLSLHTVSWILWLILSAPWLYLCFFTLVWNPYLLPWSEKSILKSLYLDISSIPICLLFWTFDLSFYASLASLYSNISLGRFFTKFIFCTFPIST